MSSTNAPIADHLLGVLPPAVQEFLRPARLGTPRKRRDCVDDLVIGIHYTAASVADLRGPGWTSHISTDWNACNCAHHKFDLLHLYWQGTRPYKTGREAL